MKGSRNQIRLISAPLSTHNDTWTGLGQTRPRGIRVMENQFYKRFATAVLRSRPQIIQAQRAFTNRKKIKYEKNGSSRLTETHFWPWCQTTSRIEQRRSNGMQEEARRGAGVGRRDLPRPTLSPSLPFLTPSSGAVRIGHPLDAHPMETWENLQSNVKSMDEPYL